VALLVAIAAAGVFARMSVADGGMSLTVGGLLTLLGLLLSWRGIRDLDRSLSPLPRPTESATLVNHGVYGSIRHPIYSGVILSALGWSLATLSPLALALSALLAVLLDLKSRREEEWLRGRYPAYADYSRRTKRFIPRLY
jgi:protein-S-isoprenylcysteine O-methyltransferase Ste14